MQKEANQANAENDKIHREFDIREAKTEALIRQQQRSYDLLMRLRIELDMMIVATDIQEKNIIKQIKSNQAAERYDSFAEWMIRSISCMLQIYWVNYGVER